MRAAVADANTEPDRDTDPDPDADADRDAERDTEPDSFARTGSDAAAVLGGRPAAMTRSEVHEHVE